MDNFWTTDFYQLSNKAKLLRDEVKINLNQRYCYNRTIRWSIRSSIACSLPGPEERWNDFVIKSYFNCSEVILRRNCWWDMMGTTTDSNSQSQYVYASRINHSVIETGSGPKGSQTWDDQWLLDWLHKRWWRHDFRKPLLDLPTGKFISVVLRPCWCPRQGLASLNLSQANALIVLAQELWEVVDNMLGISIRWQSVDIAMNK